MKIAIIGDLHFGTKKSNDLFVKSQIKFLKNEFIPYLKNNGIKKIFIIGDLFETRNHLNVKTFNTVFDLFNTDLKEFDITIFVGNHDIYYNSTTEVHSIKWLKKFDNVTLIEDITSIELDNRKILIVPWQVNYKEFSKYIVDNKIESDICLGHFDIIGFLLNNHHICDQGLDRDILSDRFKYVFSGHFHTRNKQIKKDSEIVYIGSPWHLTRNDIDEEKGFVELDLEKMKYKFVNNNSSLRFISINYPENISKKLIEGNIVDVHVKYDKDYEEDKFQEYIKLIESYGPASPPIPKIISNFSDDGDTKDLQIKNMHQLMTEYVSTIKDIRNANHIYSIMDRLYNECKNDI